MKPYKHLTHSERYYIKSAIQLKQAPVEIAQHLGRDPTTIRREINRAGGHYCYDSDHSQMTYERLKKQKRQPYRFKGVLKDQALKLLTDVDLEPAGISPRLQLEHGPSMKISHMTIYRHVYNDAANGGSLWKHLRTGRKRLKPRRKQKTVRDFIKNRRFIDQRPAVVDQLARIGDLERDTMVGPGNKGAVLSIIDRKSSYCWLGQVHNRSPRNTHNMTRKLLRPHRHCIHSITNDNGIEFADHQLTARYFGIDIWFAHPYQTNQRARNEYTNKLVRQYLPKKRDLRFVQPKELRSIEDKLNHRPRKMLGYKTPYEVLFGVNTILTEPDTS